MQLYKVKVTYEVILAQEGVCGVALRQLSVPEIN